MSKYDVFISYSRKDTPQVQELIDRLMFEIPQLKIWYDIDGIESAADFQTKIINAINESNTLIFVCSKNSLDSEYCRKEIMFAKNKGKNVIPYLLPGMELDGWLLFEFGTINCIHSTKEDEVARMINDLKKWSGVSSTTGAIQIGNGNTLTANVLGEESKQSSSNQPDAVGNSKTDLIEYNLEFDPVSGEFKQSNKSQYSSTAKSKPLIGDVNDHEYVDLGLPSGLKWASHNIGAKFLEDAGDYFAWGEIKPKSTYSAQNSATYRKSIDQLLSQGYITKDGNLKPAFDAAHQLWGGPWRMPTQAEIEELVRNTKWAWTTVAGVKGSLAMSNVNSNSIFLPATGWKNYDQDEYVGEYGDFWCASVDKNDDQLAQYLFNNHVGLGTYQNSRFLGFPIRPVMD